MGQWEKTEDYGQITSLCNAFNKGRLYEIFWQYSITEDELIKQKGKAWLYTEEGRATGFALSRKAGKLTTLEELWGGMDGFFGDQQGKLNSVDTGKVKECATIFESIEKPARLRVPIDNHFGGGVAMEFGLKWLNGMVLSTKELTNPIEHEVPRGISIRAGRDGDAVNIKKMHDIHYSSFNDIKVYSDWMKKGNCETYVAEVDGKFAGHVIAEVRPYGLGDFDIAVGPKNFNQGIGSALLVTGLNSLFRRGVKHAIADFMVMNAATNNFYLHHGFKLERAYNYFSI